MFDAATLAWMRAAQTGAMQDLCLIQTYARTFNSFAEPVETWTDSPTTTACGLDMRPGSERHGADMTTVEYDATLRLPISTTIDARDHIKVTHRYGEAITAQVYRVEGPVQRGPSGIRLRLRKVEV